MRRWGGYKNDWHQVTHLCCQTTNMLLDYFDVIFIMLKSHFHLISIIKRRVECVCVNVMDMDICIMNLQLKWACTVYVHYVSAQESLDSRQNEQSYTCNPIFSASWRLNKLIPRNAMTTAVVIPRHLFNNILTFNSV